MGENIGSKSMGENLGDNLWEKIWEIIIASAYVSLYNRTRFEFV